MMNCNVFQPPGHEKSSQKCNLNRRKLVRFGRRKKGNFFLPLIDQNTQESLPRISLLLWGCFWPPGHEKSSQKCNLNRRKLVRFGRRKKGNFFLPLIDQNTQESLPRISLLLWRCFWPPGHEKSSQKCNLNRRKLVRFGRRKKGNFFTFNRSKYAGILASNLPSSLKMFLTTWPRKIESEMQFKPAKTCPLWPAKKGEFFYL